MKILKCNVCGKVVIEMVENGPTPKCCGQDMTLLTPNTTDAAQEKHVPAVTVGEKVEVVVGETIHPMEEAHSIQFILLETDKGCHIKHLSPGMEPEAEFNVSGEKPVAAYEYCNLHGLWVKNL